MLIFLIWRLYQALYFQVQKFNQTHSNPYVGIGACRSRCWTKKDNLQDEMPFNFDFLAYVKFESNLMCKNFT